MHDFNNSIHNTETQKVSQDEKRMLYGRHERVTSGHVIGRHKRPYKCTSNSQKCQWLVRLETNVM